MTIPKLRPHLTLVIKNDLIPSPKITPLFAAFAYFMMALAAKLAPQAVYPANTSQPPYLACDTTVH